MPDLPAAPARLAQLDGLRGLAALAVALHHVFLLFARWPLSGGPISILINWLTAFGWTLVDLFFVLSGYVFAHVYLASGLLTTSRGRIEFVVARFARLYPLHLAALVLFAVVDRGNPANTAAAFLSHLSLLPLAFFPFAATSYDGAAWSLSVEAVCYVIFVVMASAGHRAVVVGTALFAGLGMVLLACYGAVGDPTVADMLRRGFMGFFLGQGLWLARARLARLPVVLLLAGVVGGFAMQSWLPVMPVLPLGLAAWPSALLLALRWQVMGSRPLVWLGDRSYAIYLLNLTIILPVRQFVDASALSPVVLAALELAMVGAILVVADWCHRGFERPVRTALRTGALKLTGTKPFHNPYRFQRCEVQDADS
jgi:peptidoglycan/LPS O-acetylase OafA/YrhL